MTHHARSIASRACAAVAILAAVLGAHPVLAQSDYSCVWVGTSSSDWSQAANWTSCNSGTAYPNNAAGTTYDATVNNSGFVYLLSGESVTVGNVTISNGSWYLYGGSSASLTGDLTNSGTSQLYSGSSLAVGGSLTNSGYLYDDTTGAGGGVGLTVGGGLTDTGYLQVGDGYDAGTLTVGTLSIPGGTLKIFGGSGAPSTVTVDGAAPGTLQGTISLTADAGGAVLNFAGGGAIAQIGGGNGGTSGSISLNGAGAAVESSGAAGNSGLSQLGIIASNGSLDLEGGATVATTTGLGNAGGITVDTSGAAGGGALSLGGALANSGTVTIGTSALASGDTASLTARSLASGTWQGSLTLTSGSGGGTAQFVTGSGITTIGPGGSISVNGGQAYLETQSGANADTALASLGAIASGGQLTLDNGAAVSTSGTLTNDGTVGVDVGYQAGGSRLTVNGDLANEGSLYIGNSNGLAAPTVTVTGTLVNSGGIAVYGNGTAGANASLGAGALENTGSISLIGGGAPGGGEALLSVTGSALTTLLGDFYLNSGGGGIAALEFGGSQTIHEIGNGTTQSGTLNLSGPDSYVELASNPGASSALDLTTIATNGTLSLESGATLGTGALTNLGSINIDVTGTGGSTLTTGALTNNGFSSIQIGNTGLASGTASTLTAASLDNPSGSNAWDGYLGVTSGQGTATLITGDTAIQTIASDGQIALNGAGASVDLRAGDTGSTALSTLSAITGGYLDLENGASLSTSTGLTLSQSGEVDVGAYSTGSNSTLDVGGVLAVAPSYGFIVVGNSSTSSGQSATMSVGGLASSAWNGSLTVDAGSGSGAFITGGSAIDAIGTDGVIRLDGGTDGAAYVELASGSNSNSALSSLASIGAGGTLALNNGESLTTGALGNNGYITIDSTGSGSSLTVNGVLTSTAALDPDGSGTWIGGVSIGNGFGPSDSTVTVAGVASATAGANVLDGNFNIEGGGNATGPNGTAALILTNPANGITGIAANGSLLLQNGNSLVELAGQTGSNSGLATLASNAGSLELLSGSTVTARPASLTFLNSGNIDIQDSGPVPSASQLLIAGSMTDAGGSVFLGGAGAQQTAALIVAGNMTSAGYVTIDPYATVAVSGTYANIGMPSMTHVYGTLAAANVANSGILDGTGTIQGNVTNSGVLGAGAFLGLAPGTLTLNGNLTQTTAGILGASIENLSGASSQLNVSGSAALGGTLAAVIENPFGKPLTLASGDSVNLLTAQGGISGNFANVGVEYDGTVSLSAGQSVIVDGGITLTSTVSGNDLALTAATTANQANWAGGAGAWSSGNWSSTPTATSNVAIATQGASAGDVTLDTSPTVNSLIVGAGNVLQFASTTPETLTASNIVTVDAGAGLLMTTAGDALKTSNAVNVSGALDVENGASVQAAEGAVGTGALLSIDSNASVGSAGGSSVTITGTLYNTQGTITVGNSGLTKNSILTVGALLNAGGTIELTGGSTGRALLDVTGPAGAFQPIDQGTLYSGEYYLSGNAALEYAGPAITSIEGSTVVLNGTQASILANGANALASLTSNQGTLELDNGASLSVAALANSGTLNLGNPQLTLPAGPRLTNVPGGALTITGPAGSFSSLSSAGQLYRGVYYVGPGGTLTFDNGGAGIASIARNTSLTLDGTSASIVDTAAGLGQNSALEGKLAANYGTLLLEHGATITTGNFENQGTLGLVGGTLNVTGSFNSTFQEPPDTPGAGTETSLEEGGLYVASLNANGSSAGGADLVLSSGPIQEIDGKAAVTLNGANAYISLAGQTGSNSALTSLGENEGTLELDNGSALTVSSLANTGTVRLGGGSLTVSGPSGSFQSVDGQGDLYEGSLVISSDYLVQDPGTGGSILEAANVGPGTLTYNGPAITSIGAGGSLQLVGGNAAVLDGASNALAGLTANAGTLDYELGANATLTNVTNSGRLLIDTSAFESPNGLLSQNGLYIQGGAPYVSGGTTTTVTGTLDNTSTVSIGNSALGSASTLDVNNYLNTGTTQITGVIGGGLGLLDITGSFESVTGAGELTSGSYYLAGNAQLEYAGPAITAIDSSVDISLTGPGAVIELAGQTGSNSALTTLASNAGVVDLEGGASLTTQSGTNLTNTGTLMVDGSDGLGGSQLTIGGTLTNYEESNGYPSGGNIVIGNALLQSGALARMSVNGLADVSGGPSGTWHGGLTVTSGNGTAELITGTQITAIASDGTIRIDGSSAYVKQTASGTGSTALTTLASNQGTLDLEDGASLSTSQALTNGGTLEVDGGCYYQCSAGSQLTIGGALTNYVNGTFGKQGGSIDVGNSALPAGVSSTLSVQGLADASGSATSLWEGDLTVTSGQGTANLITNNSGITGIDSGASITLDGPGAYVKDAQGDSGSSALATLASNQGTLDLEGGASASTTGNFLNTGTVSVDSRCYYQCSGGSHLTIGGALTNYTVQSYGNQPGNISIGGPGLQTGESSTMTVHGLDNAAGQSTTVWEGDLSLTSGQGTATFVTNTSGITGIDSSAGITLSGAGSYLKNAQSDTGSTALATLGSIGAGGYLDLESGAHVSTAANTSLFNSGSISIDSNSYGSNGSSLSLGGALANSGPGGSGTISIGNSALTSTESSTLSANGLADSSGNPSGLWEGSLTVTSGQGTAALVTNAPITSIDANASISLDGAGAYVETHSGDQSNSALASLSSNVGSLTLEDGAQITTSSDFTNTGTVNVDAYTAGGSSLTVGSKGTGNLTNGNGSAYASITVGGSYQMSSPATITAGTITNDNQAYLSVYGTNGPKGTVAGAGTLVATNLVNGGTITNGSSFQGGGFIDLGGATSAQGGFAMGAGSTMTELIGGTYSGSYGTINASGNVSLAGTLALQTINGFSFAASDSFNLINLPTTPGALSGQFATLSYGSCNGTGSSPLVCGGLQYTLAYDQGNSGAVVLTVSNAPTSTEDDWIDTTDTWNNSTNYAADWSDGAPPTATQDVKVGTGAGGTVTYNDPADTVNSLTVQAGTSSGYTLTFGAGNTLTATHGVTIASGGEIDVETSGAALDTSTLSNTGGTLQVGGNGGAR